jgi:hypothetical protein
VDTPDIKGRVQIFGVHLGKLKLEKAIEHYSGELSATQGWVSLSRVRVLLGRGLHYLSAVKEGD